MSAPKILLAHGGGGELTDELLAETILPRLAETGPLALDDSARLPALEGEMAFTTDAYVVSPLFFPGGDIGRLAVCGTVNDLAVAGAEPLWLSVALVLEEGFAFEALERVLDSMADAAREARVRLVTGDTKVVPRGLADGLYVVTAGVGRMRPGVELSLARVREGDEVLVSGPVGDHGVAVLLARPDAPISSPDIESDAAPLGDLAAALLAAVPGTRFLRDATRGGLAGVLSDLARGTGLGVRVEESRIPVRRRVREATEILGLDPLVIANEGKLVAVVPAGEGEAALAALRGSVRGQKAALIGRICPGPARCELETEYGGRRVLAKPYGEELPRIC